MDSFFYIVLFLIGMSLGSFLNVVTRRYHPEDNRKIFSYIQGRSQCEGCERTLVWYELIPLVSFFIQKGRCRRCHQKLSIQYPVVEFLGGIILVGIGHLFFTTSLGWGVDSFFVWGAIVLWTFIWFLFGLIILVDLKWKIIPNGVNLTLFVMGVIWTIFSHYSTVFPLSLQGSFLGEYAQMFPVFENIFFAHGIGALIGGGFFFLIVFITRGKGMGMGDVKLAGALGMLFGWPDIALVVVLSFIVGMIGVIPLLIMKKKGFSDAVPFGPALIIGAGIVFFCGSVFLERYFDILYILLGV